MGLGLVQGLGSEEVSVVHNMHKLGEITRVLIFHLHSEEI